MNKKDYKFLEENLSELVTHDIISDDQFQNAKNYFSSKKEKSAVTILGAIGILLIALSIITIFAINWDSIPTSIKALVSFVPLLITSVMLYFYMENGQKTMQLYTSIFAPISIIATNSLISQIFHIQTELFEIIAISLLMFLPIAIILRNYISVIVYGVGTIIYSFAAFSLDTNMLSAFLFSLPLIIANIYYYMNDRENNLNITLWGINIINLTLLLFLNEIFSVNILLIYLYLIHLVTQTLFKNTVNLNKNILSLFNVFLIISCIDPIMIFYAESIEFGFDTIIVSLLLVLFIYLSKAYLEPKEYFIFAFIFLLQYIPLDSELLFICANIIAIALGVYRITNGSKTNSYHEIKRGITTILLIILFRFISSDLSFGFKSIIFLIAGICFMLSSKVMKKMMGGNKDEEIK